MPDSHKSVRLAEPSDAPAVARMHHDFQIEYDDVTPGVEVLTERIAMTLDSGEITVLLGGDGPDAFAIVRFATSLVTVGFEAYLAELYVAPARRGQGIGRALLRGAMEVCRGRGATWIFLGTSDDDRVARILYESEGFTNREGGETGPLMYFYEREL
ncbi:MAG: GNAT family N-acetyltransferase [Solirubrobacterales bacterium]